MSNKRSFFERLTGGVHVDDGEREEEKILPARFAQASASKGSGWMEEESDDGELAVDVYQTPDSIMVKAMIAGVRPEDLDVSITRDMVTIRGKRQEAQEVTSDDYYFKELYWGTFSRTILLPQEVEPEEAEATEKNGLLIIHLPKIDRKKVAKLKVRSS